MTHTTYIIHDKNVHTKMAQNCQFTLAHRSEKIMKRNRFIKSPMEGRIPEKGVF